MILADRRFPYTGEGRCRTSHVYRVPTLDLRNTGQAIKEQCKFKKLQFFSRFSLFRVSFIGVNTQFVQKKGTRVEERKKATLGSTRPADGGCGKSYDGSSDIAGRKTGRSGRWTHVGQYHGEGKAAICFGLLLQGDCCYIRTKHKEKTVWILEILLASRGKA